MSDIVERLLDAPWADQELMEEAADEIKRLRAELQETRLNHITTIGELQTAAVQVERLRAESAEDEALREQMAQILHATAVALHGGPLVNGLWSWHDVPERAERLRAAGDALATSLAEFSDPEGWPSLATRDEKRLLAWKEARRG